MRQKCFSLLLFALLFPSTAFTGPILVPSEVPTIQEAIELAQSGEIILVESGTYFETINFLGKAITLQSLDGAEETLIDGSSVATVVTFASGEGLDSVLDGFTITHGWMFNDEGGGIYCLNSSPTLRNCIIHENTAFLGGGIYASGSSLQVEHTVISENHGGFGGGLHCVDSAPTLLHCRVRDNFAAYGVDGGKGGGVFSVESALDLISCIFNGNSSREVLSGGGIHSEGAQPLTVTNCVVYDNTGYISAGVLSFSPATITNSIVWNNLDFGDFPFGVTKTGTVSHCIIEGGYEFSEDLIIDSDPLWVDPLNGDVHLQPGSPALNTGRNDAPGLPPLDIDGDPRIV